jgi:hypothetical protein
MGLNLYRGFESLGLRQNDVVYPSSGNINVPRQSIWGQPQRFEEFFLQYLAGRGRCNFFDDLTPLMVIDRYYIVCACVSTHETNPPPVIDEGATQFADLLRNCRKLDCDLLSKCRRRTCQCSQR